MSKPSIPSGTRDFGPKETLKRNYIFDSIKTVFQRYGFMPIETPAMENLSTLTGKYGDEGDQLIFKILNSGDFLAKADIEKLNLKDSKKVLSQISERALRYDLTVPTARYVVMHKNDITFPFKRYQIQNVWRADRPQKGRYREFYQCDADIIGSDSLINEIDLVNIIDDVFFKLGVKVLIKINNRKILSGIAEVIGEKNKIIEITVAIDKLDKIGEEGVIKELIEKGISDNAIAKLKPLISFSGTQEDKIAFLSGFLSSSPIGLKGIEELEFIFDNFKNHSFNNSELELDITLARGLNYYTGAIFEVKGNDSRSDFKSSICGGGRYDDLTGVFGMPGMSGVGISFGADRIYDVMEELHLFPTESQNTTKVLFVNFGVSEVEKAMQCAYALRKAGINTEVYPDQTKKIGKQMEYATAKKIEYIALIEAPELADNTIRLRNMNTREEWKISIEELIGILI